MPRSIDLTDAGRLQGEIPLGYYRIRRAIEDIDGFPAELAQAVAHIILSHHGSLEHGSPVVPCTREATLVHMIDNLGGRLGSFDRLEKELAPGARWSSFDRAIGRRRVLRRAARAASEPPGRPSDVPPGRAEAEPAGPRLRQRPRSCLSDPQIAVGGPAGGQRLAAGFYL